MTVTVGMKRERALDCITEYMHCNGISYIHGMMMMMKMMTKEMQILIPILLINSIGKYNIYKQLDNDDNDDDDDES